jgi:hypothetical protein
LLVPQVLTAFELLLTRCTMRGKQDQRSCDNGSSDLCDFAHYGMKRRQRLCPSSAFSAVSNSLDINGFRHTVRRALKTRSDKLSSLENIE